MSDKELRDKVNTLDIEEIKELAFLLLKSREKTRIRAIKHRERKKKEIKTKDNN